MCQEIKQCIIELDANLFIECMNVGIGTLSVENGYGAAPFLCPDLVYCITFSSTLECNLKFGLKTHNLSMAFYRNLLESPLIFDWLNRVS